MQGLNESQRSPHPVHRRAFGAFAALAVCASLLFASIPGQARADGAASTRNIIFGAAAVGGTLLIINHNKKVHQKEAEMQQSAADAQMQASNAQAAYQSEHSAYLHEAALVEDYKREVAYQHQQVTLLRRQLRTTQGQLAQARTQSSPVSSSGNGVASGGWQGWGLQQTALLR